MGDSLCWLFEESTILGVQGAWGDDVVGLG